MALKGARSDPDQGIKGAKPRLREPKIPRRLFFLNVLSPVRVGTFGQRDQFLQKPVNHICSLLEHFVRKGSAKLRFQVSRKGQQL
jgi:hypothetical protein